MDRKWRRRNEDIIETKEEWYIKRISKTKSQEKTRERKKEKQKK